MAWDWDVNDFIPPTAPQDTLENRNINLMCYLLKDSTFTELLAGPLDAALDRIAANLADLPAKLDVDAHRIPHLIKSDLLAHIEAIQRILQTRTGDELEVISGAFFYAQQFTSPEGPTRLYYEALQEFERIRANRRLDHVCIPFLPMQRTGQLLKKEYVEDFLEHLGNKTLFNLFTEKRKSYAAEVRAAIGRAKENGILNSSQDTVTVNGIRMAIIYLKNNHKCSGGKCVQNDGTWCSSDEEGDCAAISYSDDIRENELTTTHKEKRTMHWDWDIKDAMPYTMKMKTINFMAYMFHNAPYSFTLDGPIENVIRRMIMNTNKLPKRLNSGARTRTREIQARMLTHFQSIEALVPDPANPTGIKLRDFYETKNKDLNQAQLDVLDEFQNFHRKDQVTGKNEFKHFCMPFLAIQQKSKADPNFDVVDKADMDRFLKRVGHITILDLYSYARRLLSAQEISGITDGYSSGILEFTQTSYSGDEPVVIMTPPPGNGMTCQNNSCVDGDPDDWCTEDENGNCTAGS